MSVHMIASSTANEEELRKYHGHLKTIPRCTLKQPAVSMLAVGRREGLFPVRHAQGITKWGRLPWQASPLGNPRATATKSAGRRRGCDKIESKACQAGYYWFEGYHSQRTFGSKWKLPYSDLSRWWYNFHMPPFMGHHHAGTEGEHGAYWWAGSQRRI